MSEKTVAYYDITITLRVRRDGAVERLLANYGHIRRMDGPDRIQESEHLEYFAAELADALHYNTCLDSEDLSVSVDGEVMFDHEGEWD